MHLVQILLPVQDVSRERYETVLRTLTDRFGGVTAYSRAPAAGLWMEKPGKPVHDDIMVYEVMVESLDARWWREYRASLEGLFQQQELVVRALPIERL